MFNTTHSISGNQNSPYPQIGRFAVVPIWMLQLELRPAALKTWMAISAFCDGTNTCSLSAKQISTHTNVSIPSVHRSIVELRDKGLIKTRPAYDSVGSSCGLIYTMLGVNQGSES